MHAHLGVLGVTGFLMKNLSANPLDYAEGGAFNQQRQEAVRDPDATNPDLSAFQKRGGKMIVTIGTNDTLASPGAQLDYFQSVIDRMGRSTVDQFARLLVMPQTGHGLTRTSYAVDRRGAHHSPIPNRYDQLGLLSEWVEEDKVCAWHGGDRDRQRQEPAALFVSDLSAIPQGGAHVGECVRMRGRVQMKLGGKTREDQTPESKTNQQLGV